jgi:hypothetical protein
MRTPLKVLLGVAALAMVSAASPPSTEACQKPLPPGVRALLMRTGPTTFQIMLFNAAAFGASGGEMCGCAISLPTKFFDPGLNFCSVDSATLTDPDGNPTPFGTFNPDPVTQASFEALSAYADAVGNQPGHLTIFAFAALIGSPVLEDTPLKLTFEFSCSDEFIADKIARKLGRLLAHSAVVGTAPLMPDGTLDTSDPSHVGVTTASVPSSGCARTAAKAATKFLAAKTKALKKCEEGKVKGQHSGTCPDAGASVGTPPRIAADKIAKASSKLQSSIAKKCGGADKVCGTPDEGEFEPLPTGWPTTCPNFENGACNNAIADCADLTACYECVAESAIDQAIDLYYHFLVPTNPIAEVALNKCQQAIGRETSKYLVAKDKTLLKCWDGRIQGLHNLGCPDATANPDLSAEKPAFTAAAKIAKAESKKIAAICKACGGADNLCDDVVDAVNPLVPPLGGSGGGDDVNLASIVTLTSCPDVTVPAAPGRPALPCLRSITTLADLVFCLDCVTEYKVDCADRARLPLKLLGLSVPPECNP